MKSDRAQADDLVRTWDRVMAANPESGVRLPDDKNPYLKAIEAEDAPQSNDDINLQTAYVLLATFGFDPDSVDEFDKEAGKKIMFATAGKAMAERAEARLPHTIHQLYMALEHARQSSNRPSQEFKEQLRGMILMAYAWGYVIDRTHRLEVRDQAVYQALAKFSTTLPNTPERAAVTRSAENKLEQMTGLLLQAIDDAERKLLYSVRLFSTGSLMMLYALANCAFGESASYDEALA
jgi:hypothetical protein